MLNVQRHSMILELIKERKNIKLNEITKELNISEATARRDLNFLEEKGKIKRVHGGAVLAENKEDDINYKKHVNQKEKNEIGKKASSLVKDGDTIYLDAGTTTETIIKHLAEKKNIKVVTNGFTHIQELLNFGIESYLLGGKLKGTTGAVIGVAAVSALKNYNFDIAFMGANGVNTEGYSTPDWEEALVKTEAVKRGEKVYFLCDDSKFDKKSFINFASLSDGKLITNKDIPENIKEKLNQEE